MNPRAETHHATETETCCTCRFWKLARSVEIKGRGEVFVGFCRYAPPVDGWPGTEETDCCSQYQPKATRAEATDAAR